MKVIKIKARLKQETETQAKQKDKTEIPKSERKRYSARTIAMFLYNHLIYVGVYMAAIFGIYGFWNVSFDGVIYNIVKWVFIIGLAVMAIIVFFAQIESFKDSKKDVESHFSNNINLVALIIATIALLKGVG